MASEPGDQLSDERGPSIDAARRDDAEQIVLAHPTREEVIGGGDDDPSLHDAILEPLGCQPPASLGLPDQTGHRGTEIPDHEPARRLLPPPQVVHHVVAHPWGARPREEDPAVRAFLQLTVESSEQVGQRARPASSLPGKEPVLVQEGRVRPHTRPLQLLRPRRAERVEVCPVRGGEHEGTGARHGAGLGAEALDRVLGLEPIGNTEENEGTGIPTRAADRRFSPPAALSDPTGRLESLQCVALDAVPLSLQQDMRHDPGKGELLLPAFIGKWRRDRSV